MLSSQPSHTEHTPSIPIIGSIGRLRRIGHNERNTSDAVFQFGGVMDDVNRYRTDVAAAEKRRQHEQREKRAQRIEVRRNWISNLETSRWDRMAAEVEKSDGILQQKQAASRVGKNSKGYDPITLKYLPSIDGARLAEEDARDMRNLAARATKLYLRNNTFDPLRCQDVLPAAEPLRTNKRQKPKREMNDIIRHIVPLDPPAFREGAEKVLSAAMADKAGGTGSK